MIENMTKAELKEQLRANDIPVPLKATAEELKKLLAQAIEAGEAELKFLENKGEGTEDATAELEDADQPANDSEETVSEITDADDSGTDAPVEKAAAQVGQQATLVQCMQQMLGRPIR